MNVQTPLVDYLLESHGTEMEGDSVNLDKLQDGMEWYLVQQTELEELDKNLPRVTLFEQTWVAIHPSKLL